MFTMTTLRPLAFLATALHPNSFYVSADTLEKAIKRGHTTLVCNAMMAETSSHDITMHCESEEQLLDYVHDVEQMVEIRVDSRVESLGLMHSVDYADEIVGRVYIMTLIMCLQESPDLTKDARMVMLNAMRQLAKGLQSLVADAEGCHWTK